MRQHLGGIATAFGTTVTSGEGGDAPGGAGDSVARAGSFVSVPFPKLGGGYVSVRSRPLQSIRVMTFTLLYA